MASFSAGTTFTDGVANDVTAAKLAALVNAATPTSGLIQDRTAETSTAVNDTLLIGDASDSNNLKRMTVANFAGTLPTATITSGTITNLASTTGTIATLNSTTGTITTGVIPTLTSITKITSGTGTAAAPAISPTGDTNTGIFFPAADTVAFSKGGAESMRIDSSGNVGIGTTNPAYRLNVQTVNASGLNKDIVVRAGDETNFFRQSLVYNNSASTAGAFPAQSGGLYWEHGGGFGASGGLVIATNSANAGPVILATADTERLRIDASGDVGIGTDSPIAKLNVYNSSSAIFSLQGDSTTQVIANRASTDISSPTVALRKSRGSIASPTAVATGDSIGDLSFQAFGGTTIRNLSRIRASVEAYVSDSDISSNLTFLTSPAGAVAPTERMRIDSSGNVSIGTATALSRLHVHGDLTMSNATTAVTASTSTITPPATVAGYLTVSINGTSRKIAYYAT